MDGTSLRDEIQRQSQAGQMQACLLSSRRGANDAMGLLPIWIEVYSRRRYALNLLIMTEVANL